MCSSCKFLPPAEENELFKAIVGLFRIYSESLPVPGRRYYLNSIDHDCIGGDLRLSNTIFFYGH